jgi:hypothetical protein
MVAGKVGAKKAQLLYADEKMTDLHIVDDTRQLRPCEVFKRRSPQ